MSDVIAILQLEHRKTESLLGFIQQQATNISRTAPVNHSLLELAFEYLSGYPDQCHHPKEDVLYRKLIRRSPGLAQSLKNLVEEHAQLAGMTRNLWQVLGESKKDRSGSQQELAEHLTAYVDFYHHHMRMEEEHFFPLAKDRLSRDDLDEVDFALFDKPDPLFSRGAERKFAELRDEITRLGIAERASAMRREESALLATFVDIATCNETMQKMGEAFVLVRSPGGGYTLECAGQTQVNIPECSEPRAAWCAYFFWKAATATRNSS
jgi:hemerythrin-like domain-containing protein